jgi:arylsulfatase A-like enzyme
MATVVIFGMIILIVFIEFLLRKKEEVPERDRKALEQSKTQSKAKEVFEKLPEDVREGLRNTHYFEKLMNLEDGAYGQALYDEMIVYLDEKLQELFNFVSSDQLKNDTILVITSDHGEEFMEHGRMSHPVDSLYNNVTSSVLVMYIPGVKHKNIPQMVESVDILPTVLDIVGIDKKLSTDGIDLTGLIQGQKDAPKNKYLISQGLNIDSIRDDRSKLYTTYGPEIVGKELKLFDLKNDAGEQNDISLNDQQTIQNLYKSLQEIIYDK